MRCAASRRSMTRRCRQSSTASPAANSSGEVPGMTDDNIVRLAAVNDAPPKAVTEDSVALEFAERYRDELRYDHQVGRWYRWTGKYWECERTKLAFEWSRQLVRELGGSSGNSKQVSKTTFAAGVERFA